MIWHIQTVIYRYNISVSVTDQMAAMLVMS